MREKYKDLRFNRTHTGCWQYERPLIKDTVYSLLLTETLSRTPVYIVDQEKKLKIIQNQSMGVSLKREYFCICSKT